MKTTDRVILSALAGMFALRLAGPLSAGSAFAAEEGKEKCASVVKAGKNDCQTSAHSCAGLGGVDDQRIGKFDHDLI
jgi:uncharacterized membrane protein